jgi:hypothetical protein
MRGVLEMINGLGEIKKVVAILILLIAVTFAGRSNSAFDGLRSADTYNVAWQVISSGGTDGGSASFLLMGSVAQTASGHGSSDNFVLDHGFWQEYQGGPCDCQPGDANGDLQINVGDAVYLISYVFKGGPPPVPYAVCSGDANGDCQCNVGDAVYIISYVFKGGPPPVDCETWIGNCGPPLIK